MFSQLVPGVVFDEERHELLHWGVGEVVGGCKDRRVDDVRLCGIAVGVDQLISEPLGDGIGSGVV